MMPVLTDIELLEKAVYADPHDMAARNALADALAESGDEKSSLFWKMTVRFGLVPFYKEEMKAISWDYAELNGLIRRWGDVTPGFGCPEWYNREPSTENAFKRLKIGFDACCKEGVEAVITKQELLTMVRSWIERREPHELILLDALEEYGFDVEVIFEFNQSADLCYSIRKHLTNPNCPTTKGCRVACTGTKHILTVLGETP